MFCAVGLPSAHAQSGPDATPGAYVLQRGDELEIKVLRLPELEQECVVRPDGKVSLLLVEDMDAAGLTASQLGERLSERYGKQYRDPKVSVIVKSFAKMSVYVGGDVAQPGSMPLKGDLTAASAIIKAGGLRETAKGNSVVVLRGVDQGKPEVININIDDVLANGEHDVVLKPSDVVFVPKSNIPVYVGGEVVRPGLVPLIGQMTALAAVLQAGGLRETAKANSALLVRNNGSGSPLVTKLRLDAMMKGQVDATLKPYDVIFVPKSKIANIDRFVDQYIRQVLPVQVSGGFSYLFGGRLN